MSASTNASLINHQHKLLAAVSGAWGLFSGRYGQAVEQADSGNLQAVALHELVGASLELLRASQTALKGLLLDMPEPPAADRFTMLSSSDRNLLEAYLKQLNTANAGIDVCATLLFKFLIDDDCGDAVPAEIKSSYIRGGLLESILSASDKVSQMSDMLLDKISYQTDSEEAAGGEV